jgi:hypothetical protein
MTNLRGTGSWVTHQFTGRRPPDIVDFYDTTGIGIFIGAAQFQRADPVQG